MSFLNGNFSSGDTGLRSDAYTTDSLYALVKRIEGNKQARVYPTLANSTLLTSGATPWLLGSFIQFVPVNTITSPFKIEYINFSAFSSQGNTVEVVLYSGLAGSEVEIGRVRANGGAAATGNKEPQMPIHCPILPANTRISAKMACSVTSAQTCTASIIYFTY